MYMPFTREKAALKNSEPIGDGRPHPLKPALTVACTSQLK